MSMPPASSVFTLREIARAARVPLDAVLVELGVRDRGAILLPRVDAVRLVRRLRVAGMSDAQPGTRRDLFAAPPRAVGMSGVRLAASSTAHAAIVATVLMVAGAEMTSRADVARVAAALEPLRMVYLTIPGPGGGGGGGGRAEKKPAPRAERKGSAHASSPVPVRRPAPVEAPVTRPVDPPPPVLAAEPLPPILAPVVAVPADSRDRAGTMEQSTAEADSHGAGTGGGVGTGQGTGAGEGSGPGIGAGSGGGTGGGPYRPGSGVEPPTILREVKPIYTELARQRGITGEVVLEIVVQRDGSVGAIRVLHGLGSGLDERAAEAVRQWRFAPARRLGQPVDVMVEVAVEFRLR